MHVTELLSGQTVTFHDGEAVRDALRGACQRAPDLARFHELGRSEEGRPVDGVVMGRGDRTVSLIAGNHADEPVGPETLRRFVVGVLAEPERWEALLSRFRFVVVPHTNPDGEARNQGWLRLWPDVEAYIAGAVREPPGRDLEFGFPAMRRENRLVSDFMRQHGPFALHASLHGMGFAEGAMLLVERHWTFRTDALQAAFASAARAEGLGLHDHNRKGEKGFFYVGPGFSTTPEGEAMRTYFRARGDDAMAARFHDSSMEFVRRLGGDPLCIVTEVPLFTVRRHEPHVPGVPAAYLGFKDVLPEIKLRLRQGRSVAAELRAWQVHPVDPTAAVRVHLRTLEAALKQLSLESGWYSGS